MNAFLGQGHDGSVQKAQVLPRSCNFFWHCNVFRMFIALATTPPQWPNGTMCILTFVSFLNPTPDGQLCRPLEVERKRPRRGGVGALSSYFMTCSEVDAAQAFSRDRIVERMTQELSFICVWVFSNLVLHLEPGCCCSSCQVYSDGFPVVLPTRERVEGMLRGTALDRRGGRSAVWTDSEYDSHGL